MRPAGAPTEDALGPEPEGLGHVLRATLSQAWDYWYLVAAGSLLWCVSLAPALLLAGLAGSARAAAPAAWLVGALTVGPVTVGLYGMSDAMARRELPGLGLLFCTLRRFYRRSAGLFLVETFALGGFALAAWFYQARFDYWLLEALSLLWLYVGLFGLMVALYVPALLVREDGSIWSAVRNALYLTLAHPGYSFIILLEIMCVVAIVAVPLLTRSNAALGVSFLVFFLFLPGFVPLLATNALNDLLRKHMATGEVTEDGNGEP